MELKWICVKDLEYKKIILVVKDTIIHNIEEFMYDFSILKGVNIEDLIDTIQHFIPLSEYREQKIMEILK